MRAPVPAVRRLARGLLVLLTMFWFVFALLSGAEEAGGLVRNLPNTMPWILLFALVYVAFRRELIGGVLISVAGLGSALFLNAMSGAPIVFWAISAPLVALGLALVWCGWMDRAPNERPRGGNR